MDGYTLPSCWDTRRPRLSKATFALGGAGNVAAAADVAAAAEVLNDAEAATMLVGCGAEGAQ